MSYKEEMLAVLSGKKIDKILFAPEMLRWYKWHRKAGTLPSEYRDVKLVDICDDLDVGMLPIFYCGKYQDGKEVKITEKNIGNIRQTVIETPAGKVSMEQEVRGEYELSYWPTKEFIKRVEDIEVMKYVCGRRRTEIAGEDGDYGSISHWEKEVGDRGLIRVNLPRIPLMRYFIDYVQYENGVLLLHDYPKEVEELFFAIEESDDLVYKTAGDFSTSLVNFGDNIDMTISPNLFKKYCVPYYKKRVAELHRKGKLCLCHMDGDIKDLIPLIPETGLDCVDGMPLFPMTRVKPVDVRELVSQGICVYALLPASLFTSSGYLDLLKEEVLQLKEIYNKYGRIILGVSDEFPPDGVLDRIRYVKNLLE